MAKPVGPYSPFKKAGSFVYTSGQIGLTDEGPLIEGGLAPEAEQAFKNLKSVLEDAGATTDDVVKTTVFLTDMNDYAKVNEIYGSFFGDHKPARSAIAVAALPIGATVEIEAVAYLP